MVTEFIHGPGTVPRSYNISVLLNFSQGHGTFQYPWTFSTVMKLLKTHKTVIELFHGHGIFPQS